MDKEQIINELKERIAWLQIEASESSKRSKQKIDEANFYLNIINVLMQSEGEENG